MANPKVDLMQAFSWICPSCGHRNFEKAIAIEMDKEKEKEIKDGVSDCNAWVDFLGGLFFAPKKVTCKDCKKKFEVNQDDEEEDEDAV